MIISVSQLLQHLSFWHNKTDDDCIFLATNDTSIDAGATLTNMLERDFCTLVNIDIITELTIQK